MGIGTLCRGTCEFLPAPGHLATLQWLELSSVHEERSLTAQQSILAVQGLTPLYSCAVSLLPAIPTPPVAEETKCCDDGHSFVNGASQIIRERWEFGGLECAAREGLRRWWLSGKGVPDEII